MIDHALLIALADAALLALQVGLALAVFVLVAVIAILVIANRRRNRAWRRYKARLHRQSAPDYECEDCLGCGRELGCYCQAMGAKQPGGPSL